MHFSTCVFVHFTFTKIDIPTVNIKILVCQIIGPSAAGSAGPSYARVCNLQSGPKTRGYRLMTIILSNLNRLKNFFTGRFVSQFAVKRILKIPPHLAYVATLPCETLISAKQAIHGKLQCSVATYLLCGGVVNNRIKKGLLLSL